MKKPARWSTNPPLSHEYVSLGLELPRCSFIHSCPSWWISWLLLSFFLLEPRISGKQADKTIIRIGLPSALIELRPMASPAAFAFSGQTRSRWKSWSITVHFSTQPLIIIVERIASSSRRSPKPTERKLFWQDLSAIMMNMSLPWLLAGDWNATITSEDRKGGARGTRPSSSSFQNFVQMKGLIDLGYVGTNSTWRILPICLTRCRTLHVFMIQGRGTYSTKRRFHSGWKPWVA